jgi:proline dehydrogenase
MNPHPTVSFDNTEIAFRSKSDFELKKAYWMFRIIGNPTVVKVGKVLTDIALFLRIPIGWAIRHNVFRHFCGGETIEQCSRTTAELGKYNVGTILDLSVEGQETEAAFDQAASEILSTIRTARNNPHIPFSVFKVTGIARFALLEKVNAGTELTGEEKSEWQKVEKRVDDICGLCHEYNIPVFIDAEDSWIQDAIDHLADSMMERYNREKTIVFNTIQLYRHDRLEFLKASHRKAQEKKYHVGFKLVRGAYMEKERARAIEKGYRDPIQPDKASADRDFDQALEYCIQNAQDISICAGTHNEKSSLFLTELMSKYQISPGDKRIWFAQLLGMSDHISFNLANAGYNVAKYVPFGPIRQVIPYLIRRAMENTSVKGQTGRELGLIKKEMKRRFGS